MSDETTNSTGLAAETIEAARAALDWIVGPEGGPGDLSQMQLQMFLWYSLPCKWLIEDAEHHEVAWALGDLLAAEGFERYGDLCRAPATHEVISAYHESLERGLQALRDALGASGVEPPDTDLLAWDSVMGVDESTVRDGVSEMLEASIVSGDLVVGARGWKARAARLTTDHLCAPDPDLDGRTPLDLVRTERVQRWADSGGPAWRQLHRALPPLLVEPDLAGVAARSMAPVRALLDEVGEGVTLTQSGYLPRALVVSLTDRFGWYDRPGSKVRSEADVFQLARLNAMLRKGRVLTKRGRKLTTSASARKWIADDARLFHVVAEQLMSGSDFETDVAAVRAAVLLTRGGQVSDAELSSAVRRVVAERWRTSDGDKIGSQDVWWSSGPLSVLGSALGWVQESGSWADRTVRLTDAGRAAAVIGLRSRAHAPRHQP